MRLRFRELCHELKKNAESVKIDEVRLAADLEKKAVDGFVLREGDEPAAILLFYYAYSTWEGQYIHMEDIYVRPQFRRKGYGRLLWRELGVLAKELHMETLSCMVAKSIDKRFCMHSRSKLFTGSFRVYGSELDS
ncbi:acetyltransferase, GNAT family [Cooperia oncophora]